MPLHMRGGGSPIAASEKLAENPLAEADTKSAAVRAGGLCPPITR
jgi:hypothetical protein